MVVTHEIEIDVVRSIGKYIPPIDVMQDDKYSREIQFTVKANGSDLILSGHTALIRFKKADGTGGNYDTLPDGRAAYTIDGNVVTVSLAPQVCTAIGRVDLSVAIISGKSYLHTFSVALNVHKNPGLKLFSENYMKIAGTVPDYGWTANKYLGTDATGKVIARDGRDAELDDARIDADGKVYASIGEAVRDQMAQRPGFRGLPDVESFSHLTANLTTQGFYIAQKKDGWADLPGGANDSSFALLVFWYTKNYNVQVAYSITSNFTAYRFTNVDTGEVFKDWCELDIGELKSWGIVSKNLYNPDRDTFGNRAIGTGSASLGLRNSEWIGVKAGATYVLSNTGGPTVGTSVALKVDGEVVPYGDTGFYNVGNLVLTIPAGATHIRFSPHSSAENNDTMAKFFMLEEGDRRTDYEPYKVILDYKNRLPEPMQNPWIGKKMVVDGDSITEDAGGKTYWQFVAGKILGMLLDTSISIDIPANGWRGIGGSTIANEVQAIINSGQATPENAGNPKNVGLVCRYMDLPDDADIVVIAGGSNDWAHSEIDLGETDSTDDTTFNGALNILLPGLKSKYPTIPVVMMTPIKRGNRHNSTNRKGLTLQQFVDAMIAKCREYGVYCLDMWGTCPINPQIPTMLEMLFRPNDNTHPNDAGHGVMGKTVAGFIRTLT